MPGSTAHPPAPNQAKGYPMTSDFQEKARRLRNAVEPVAAGVYFAPEAHATYAALGFEGSPVTQDGVARPDLKAYFTSRGACMGQVPGEVVAAAFGCFNPKVVVPAVGAGWQITSREAILQARERAAAAMLQRTVGDQPEGLSFCWYRGKKLHATSTASTSFPHMPGANCSPEEWRRAGNSRSSHSRQGVRVLDRPKPESRQ
jgi:hypothetical protein